jgi:hypothetical protein
MLAVPPIPAQLADPLVRRACRTNSGPEQAVSGPHQRRFNSECDIPRSGAQP